MGIFRLLNHPMKILLVHGEGIGNIVEALPLIKTLELAGHTVDLALSNVSFPFPKELFPGRNVYLPGETVPCDVYDGKVVTVWGNLKGKDILPDLKLLNALSRQAMRTDMSEVSVYLNAAKDIGISEDMFSFDCRGMLGYTEVKDEFPVVIADGYNWKNKRDWEAKSWRHHALLAKRLNEEGIRVCSVGSPNEHVTGTVDMTGLPFMESLGVIAKAKVLVTNDSGLYHCACVLGIPVVVVFTFTSGVKNYDSRFHRTASIVGADLVCRKDCHAKRRWLACDKGYACRDVAVEEVYARVKERL